MIVYVVSDWLEGCCLFAISSKRRVLTARALENDDRRSKPDVTESS